MFYGGLVTQPPVIFFNVLGGKKYVDDMIILLLYIKINFVYCLGDFLDLILTLSLNLCSLYKFLLIFGYKIYNFSVLLNIINS